MPDIQIHRSHHFDHDKARRSAREIVEHLGESLDISFHWEGDCLYFERSGLTGQLDVGPAEVRISMSLGLLLRPMKKRLEQQIHRHMDELFNHA